MGQHMGSEQSHVVGGDEVAPVGGGPRLGRTGEGDGAARADADADLGPCTRGADQGDQVLLHPCPEVDPVGDPGHRYEADGVERRRKLRAFPALLVDVEDLDLGVGFGVADVDAHEEAVELGLRELVGPFQLDGVLGGEHEKGLGDEVWLAVDGHLVLLHHLEQGGLGLGRGPVDLVGHDDVGEHRADMELERGVGLVVDLDAGDIGGEEVGGELDALERAVDRLGQGPGQRGLPDPGNVLDQEVACLLYTSPSPRDED